MKLSFLLVRRTRVGNTHFSEVLQVTVTYVMTSLKLFSFLNIENGLFSFSLMLDDDCWALEIIWRNLVTDQSDLKTLAKLRTNDNVTVMAEAVFQCKFILPF